MMRSVTLILALALGACQEREPIIIGDEFLFGPRASFYFAAGNAAVSATDQGIVRDFAREYREQTERWGRLFVLVEGHADQTGSEPFNQQLSIRRAQSIADLLEREGIPRDQLEVRSYGSTRPMVVMPKDPSPQDRTEVHSRNRRVDIRAERAGNR
jgi:outer membrane protein OmpA-like peptidoglycan-associated protein